MYMCAREHTHTHTHTHSTHTHMERLLYYDGHKNLKSPLYSDVYSKRTRVLTFQNFCLRQNPIDTSLFFFLGRDFVDTSLHP